MKREHACFSSLVFRGRRKADKATPNPHESCQDFDRSVEFEFVRTGVTDAQGRNTRQVGKEWVCFEVEDGGLKICRIIVETTHTGLVESM